MDIDARFREAVQSYWTARELQWKKQVAGGKIDAGTRGAVTGGTQTHEAATARLKRLV